MTSSELVIAQTVLSAHCRSECTSSQNSVQSWIRNTVTPTSTPASSATAKAQATPGHSLRRKRSFTSVSTTSSHLLDQSPATPSHRRKRRHCPSSICGQRSDEDQTLLLPLTAESLRAFVASMGTPADSNIVSCYDPTSCLRILLKLSNSFQHQYEAPIRRPRLRNSLGLVTVKGPRTCTGLDLRSLGTRRMTFACTWNNTECSCLTIS